MALLTSKSTAARLLDLLNGAARRVTRPAFAARVAPRGKLLPWTVKWSNRLDSIIIYIPREAVVGRTMNVTRLDHATDAQGNNLSFWYLVDMSKASNPNEVRVSLYETDSGLDVDIAPPGSGETPVARVFIARISLPTGSTVTPVVITQVVTSALSFGGGGSAAPSLVLGPMEYESSTGRVLQYAGSWSYNSDAGTWTFIKAVGEDGKTLPAAHAYQAAVADILVRRQSGSDQTIGVVQAPVLFFTSLGDWLRRQTATVTKSVDYASPTSEADMGRLKTTDSKITYFEQTGQVVTTLDRTLLTTITEEANMETTYEEV